MAFTTVNAVSGVKRAGLSPVDTTRLVGVSRPISSDKPTEIVSVDDMFKMLEIRRKK